jgi:hypothetical protein
MTSQIDLSKYVGKKVRVTFTDGRKDEYIIVETCIKEFPFKIGMGYYTNLGHSRYCINNIEEIKEINEIQELENKVKEMQAEIDRLKAKEQKEVRSFRNGIKGILSLTQISRQGMENLTDKICEIVDGYIPATYDTKGDTYDNGYNDALYKVRKNLGLIK